MRGLDLILSKTGRRRL